MKKPILTILVALVLMSGMTAVCAATETDAPDQAEATTEAQPEETTTEAQTEATTVATTPATTEQEYYSPVNTEDEWTYATPFAVTAARENTPVFADASCTDRRFIAKGEQVKVVGGDDAYYRLETGEYISHNDSITPDNASLERATEATETETTTTEPSEETEESTKKTKATKEDEGILSGIDLYEEPSETSKDSKIKAKEEQKTDPRFTVACVVGGLALAIGSVAGFFVGTWWNKRKVSLEHDTVYESIRQGEVKEALEKEKKAIQKSNMEEKARKQEEAKRKKLEKEQAAKKAKAERAEKKAKLEREKKMEKLKKMQQELGIDTAEQVAPAVIPEAKQDPDEPAQVQEEETLPSDLIDTSADENEIPEALREIEQKPRVEHSSSEEKPMQPKKTGIDPKDMVYGGKDTKGIDYYFDDNSKEPDRPFRIKDGKKVFYPVKKGDPFVDEDGNEVKYY